MNNKIILSSLAMDLKRAALGYYKGLNKTADIFCKEALQRKREVDTTTVRPYIVILLNNMEKIIRKPRKKDVAEDLLMYSTLFQNYVLKFL
jgi:hypothetical protein